MIPCVGALLVRNDMCDIDILHKRGTSMPAVTKTRPGLTGNALKLLAMAAMTADHVGLMLLPQFPLLRILGRLSLPIFAYMIAEGCRYTHDRRKYLLRLAGLALACQLVYYFAMGSLYQCILVTFTLSVCLIYAAEFSARSRAALPVLLFWGVSALVCIVCEVLPAMVPGFGIDYGLIGVLLPLVIYTQAALKRKLVAASVMLVLLSLQLGGIQWFSLAALPLLALYNGQRGTYKIGSFFYLYYPAHLVVIYGLSLLIK